MRFQNWIAGAALALVGLLPGLANAQGYCTTAQSTATEISSNTTRVIAAADGCKTLVFTSGSATTVNLPNANTLPAGFTVYIKAQGAGTVSVTPTVGTLDGGTGALALTTGTFGKIICNGTSCYSNSLGIKNP